MFPRLLLCTLLLSIPLHGAPTSPISLDQPVSATLRPDILYWNLDDGVIGESSPDPVPDRSGNGIDPVLIPRGMTPTYATGRFGTALLTAQEPGFASYPRWYSPDRETARYRDTLLLNTPEFTLGGWVKVLYTPEARAATITFLQSSQRKGKTFWSFYLLKSAQEQWTLRFDYGEARYPLGVPLDSFMQGEWHHVAVSVGGSGDGPPCVTFWCDGYPIGDPLPLQAGAAPEVIEGEPLYLIALMGLEGLGDDLFITRGAHSFTPPRAAALARNAPGD